MLRASALSCKDSYYFIIIIITLSWNIMHCKLVFKVLLLFSLYKLETAIGLLGAFRNGVLII